MMKGQHRIANLVLLVFFLFSVNSVRGQQTGEPQENEVNGIEAMIEHMKNPFGKPNASVEEIPEDIGKKLKEATEQFNRTGTVKTSQSRVSKKCEEDVQLYLDGLEGKPHGYSTTPNWAKQMSDSYGGPQAGIFQNNLYWLGDFWECVSIDVWRNDSRMSGRPPDFSGKYCLTSVILIFLGPTLIFKIGMCLPSTCSADDYSYVVSKYYKLPLFVVVQDNFCQTKEWSSWDATSVAIGVLFGVLAAVVVCGTAYEIYLTFMLRFEPKNAANRMAILNAQNGNISLQKAGWTKQLWKSLLLAFSANKNMKAVFNVHPRENSLGVVHGIRAISMSWVLVGHVFLMLHQNFPWKNQLKAAEFISNNLFQAILMGEFAVDTFFCMSGFLIAYLFLNEMKKTNGKFNILAYYFHRIWRLSPAYMLLIAYMATIYPYAGKGPIWPATFGDRNTCREKWWQNLLYINVYFSGFSDEKCLPQVWYLCLDMAYYIVSPLILYPLFKKPRLGQLIFVLFLVTSFLTPALLIHFGNLASFPASNIEPWQREKYMVQVYDKPWGRMGAFLMGMIYGYTLHRKGTSMQMKPVVVATGWTLAAGMGLWLIYGTIPYMRGQWGMSHGMFIFYGTFTRPLWAICIGWVILACATGYGGYVNSILSWKGFLPISKLSYTAYLVHFTVLAEFYASRPDSTYIDFYTMTFYTIFLFTATTVVALALTLLGEAPFITMEKLLFDFSPKKAQKTLSTEQFPHQDATEEARCKQLANGKKTL